MNTKVLLVDDEAPFVQTMKKRLARRDLSIVTAYGGCEAMEVLQKENPVDVVILDVKMPGMDGMDTLRQIKLEYPEVEVILLTGHATMEAAIEGMKLGAFDYVMKPCSIEDVLVKVREAKEKTLGHE
jgi:DNA-binding NtrC family response regulator